MVNSNQHELPDEIATIPEELRVPYVEGLLARLKAEASTQKKLVKVNDPDLPDELTTTESIRSSDLSAIDRTLRDLLTAACGLQHFENGDDELGFLMASMGQHIQRLRNDLVEQLEPIFEAFGVEAVGY